MDPNNGSISTNHDPDTASLEKHVDSPGQHDEQNVEKNSDSDQVADNCTVLSKRRIKRLKKLEKWKLALPDKRKKEKMRLKQKMEEARKNHISLGPTRKELKHRCMENSQCKVRVALDFSFDHLMSNKDICKCISQTLRCYSINRRAENPVQFYLVNFKGESSEIMSRHNGYQNWDVHIKPQPYLELFSKESLVYLSSESDNLIETFVEDKVYVIGAFVDHNAHKGLCLKVANEQGIQHGRLPISEHLDIKSRRVLAINHVFEIILNVCNGLDWKESLLKVLPQRKIVETKHVEESSSDESEAQEKESIVMATI